MGDWFGFVQETVLLIEGYFHSFWAKKTSLNQIQHSYRFLGLELAHLWQIGAV